MKGEDKMKMIEITEKDMVDYFKGKDIKKADRLLLNTAQNNFIAGMSKRKENELEFLKRLDKAYQEKISKVPVVIQRAIEKKDKDFWNGVNLAFNNFRERIQERIKLLEDKNTTK